MYAAIGLVNPKNNVNVGATLRAAACYGAAMVACCGVRYRRSPVDTVAAHRHIPLLVVPDLRPVIPYDCVPVAVEICDGAVSLFEYRHPPQAFYIFGPEDGSVPFSVRGWCRDVVYVPTHSCMNLAATVNVLLYDRAFKQAAQQL